MKQKYILTALVLVLGVVFFASPVFSAGKYDYTMMERVPGFGDTKADLPALIQNLYSFALGAIGIAALFMITLGGFWYMTSAGNTARMGTAKEMISDAILGLVVVFIAYLLLYVINPDLVNVNINFKAVSPGAMNAGQIGTPTGPPSGTTQPQIVGGGCSGIPVNGISSQQCNDASPALSGLLNCMKGKTGGSNFKINSISDSGTLETCKKNYSKPPCAHAKTSCHYGGGASKTGGDCDKSHAADFSTRNGAGAIDPAVAQQVKDAAAACGGRVNDEGNHIHVSDQTSCCSL